MGKIYLIVYFLGKIAMAVHWPDGTMPACEQARDELVKNMDNKFATSDPNDPIWHLDDVQMTRKDAQIKCELRTDLPEVDDFTH
jgi:hypothetical protein